MQNTTTQPPLKKARVEAINHHSDEATTPNAQVHHIEPTRSRSGTTHGTTKSATSESTQNEPAPYVPSCVLSSDPTTPGREAIANNSTPDLQHSIGETSANQVSSDSVGSIWPNVNHHHGPRKRRHEQEEQQTHHTCCGQRIQTPLAVPAHPVTHDGVDSHVPLTKEFCNRRPSLTNSGAQIFPDSAHYNDLHTPWLCVMPTSTERVLQILHVAISVVLLFFMQLMCRDLMYLRS
jgi:hypothetical protein